jgi:hypothetical protein
VAIVFPPRPDQQNSQETFYRTQRLEANLKGFNPAKVHYLEDFPGGFSCQEDIDHLQGK